MEIPLLGAEGYHAAWNKRGKIAKALGVHKVRIEHLLNRYGTLTDEVLDLIRERPELAEPLPGADDYIGAEVVYAASHESALHLEDVLARRTRISIEAWDRGESAAPVAAKLMAEVLGWADAETEERGRQLPQARRRRAREPAQPDDESADRVRLEAPDITFGFDEDDMVVPGRRPGRRAEARRGRRGARGHARRRHVGGRPGRSRGLATTRSRGDQAAGGAVPAGRAPRLLRPPAENAASLREHRGRARVVHRMSSPVSASVPVAKLRRLPPSDLETNHG